MKNNQKKICIISVIIVILLIFLIISVSIIKMISIIKEEHGITAKEAFNLLMDMKNYQEYQNNISSIESGSLSYEGNSNEWTFYFGKYNNGTISTFGVNIKNDGSITPYDQGTTINELDPYITNWMDSPELVENAEKLDPVKEFKEKYKSGLPALGGILFTKLDDYSSVGCMVLIRYYTQLTLFSEQHEIFVYLSGHSGIFIDVVYVS